MKTTLCINRSGSCTARLVLHRVTPKGLLSFCHCALNFQIPESPAGVTIAEWWGRQKGCGGRGGRGAYQTSWDMEECAIRLWLCPVCSPNATGGKKKKTTEKHPGNQDSWRSTRCCPGADQTLPSSDPDESSVLFNSVSKRILPVQMQL